MSMNAIPKSIMMIYRKKFTSIVCVKDKLSKTQLTPKQKVVHIQLMNRKAILC